MSDLLNRLRDRASELSDVGFFATAHEMRQAADLIDRQAAEIADLKLRLNRWNSGDNSIGAKEQVKRLTAERDIALIEITRYARATGKTEAERDEWRRRAERLLVLATKHCNKYHHDWREITGAAQWFGED